MLRVLTTIRCAAAISLLALSCAVVSAGEGRDPFELRPYDEVELKSGRTVVGFLRPWDNPDELRLESRDNVKQSIKMQDVKEVRRRQKPEDALDRIAKENAGKPQEIARYAREAVKRFSSILLPKVVAMLEKEAGSNDPDVLALLCELQLQSNQAGPALSSAEKLVKALPRPRSLMWRARANRALENFKAAEADFEKAYKEGGDDELIVVAYANFLYSIGRGAEAEKAFKTVLSRSNTNVSAWNGLGLVQMRQANFAEAEKSFSRASELNSKNTEAKIGIAAVKLMQGQYDDCYKLTVDILNLDTKNAEAYELQGLALLYKGDKDSLVKFAKNMKYALEERPSQPRFLLAYAAGLERSAKFNELLNTGESLAAAKADRELAASKYSDLMKLDPEDAYIQYFIGSRRFSDNDFTGAEAAFSRAARLALKYPQAHGALGATELKLAKWEAAKAAYERAIELDANAAEFHAGRGLALLKMQQFAQASESFKQAVAKDPLNVTALCGLAYVFNFEKNRESCVAYLQQALAADGSCSYAADALRKIYGQEGKTLEYVTFDANPVGWKPRAAGPIKPVVNGKRLEFVGKQNSAAGSKVEYYKEVKPESFQRIEADFVMAPSSPVIFGVRLAPLTGGAFEIEFGKNDGAEVNVRFRDTQTQVATWQSVGVDWPARGPVRLAIESDDLKSGIVRFVVNGKRSNPKTLALPSFKTITAGVFVQAPSQEMCNAYVDNIVLVTKGAAASGGDGPQETITISKDDKEKDATPTPPKEQK